MSLLQAALAIIPFALLLPAGTSGQYSHNPDNELGASNAGSERPIFCYQCNSGTDKECANLQANSTNSIHYKPCDSYGDYKGKKPFCRKIVQTIFERDNMERVVRKCGWEKHRLPCYFMSNDDHTEVICQCFGDGCNGAPRSALAAATLATVLAIVYFTAS